MEPGATVDISLVAYVDNSEAASLNRKSLRLDDTLILHTVLGKDHFISVEGQYGVCFLAHGCSCFKTLSMKLPERTCFANSLDWLVRLPCPVRALKNSDDLLPEEKAANAPKEIMRLINWLMTNAAEMV